MSFFCFFFNLVVSLVFVSNAFHFISLPLTNHRAEAAGNWPIAGNEHTLPLLVIFPARSLQQEDVRGVQAAGGGGRERRIQVRAMTSDGWIYRRIQFDIDLVALFLFGASLIFRI